MFPSLAATLLCVDRSHHPAPSIHLVTIIITSSLCVQAKIAFLQGERKGHENLMHDLVRRIKMLEYALKQERYK